MNAHEFIDFAGKIVAYGVPGQRSAVSRAYYGALHLAAGLLDELGCGIPRSGSGHGNAVKLLRDARHPDAVIADGLLGDLHSDRINADYRLADTRLESAAAARLSVETAVEVKRLLAAVCTECLTDENVRANVVASLLATRARLRIDGP